MANEICTLIVDSGADVSIFKLNKVAPKQIVNSANIIKLTGITENSLETLATTDTELTFGNNLTVNHTFHIVASNFPIETDGILGRDFMAKHKIT